MLSLLIDYTVIVEERALVDSHAAASAEQYFVFCFFSLRRALADSHCACFSDFSNSIKCSFI
jgi:hypothetical protein